MSSIFDTFGQSEVLDDLVLRDFSNDINIMGSANLSKNRTIYYQADKNECDQILSSSPCDFVRNIERWAQQHIDTSITLPDPPFIPAANLGNDAIAYWLNNYPPGQEQLYIQVICHPTSRSAGRFLTKILCSHEYI